LEPLAALDDARWTEAVRAKASAVRDCGAAALALLDVDLTLFDNTPRTRHILAHYLLARDMDDAERQRLLHDVWVRPIVFSVKDNLGRLGVPRDEISDRGLEFWKERFFSDAYCQFDVPYAGAAAACRRLVDSGVTVVYLTARYVDTMATGTVDAFRRHGFPICEPGTMLVMKSDRVESDDAFKRRAADGLARLGTVVAAVDNEPGHCNALLERFPDAAIACVATMHGPWAPPLDPRIPRISGLRELAERLL
jgi:hypothetical protein